MIELLHNPMITRPSGWPIRLCCPLPLHFQECSSFFSVVPKLKVFDSSQHVLLGNSIGLGCIAEEGDGPITFHWSKDGSPARSLYGVDIVQNMYSSLLGISMAYRNHTGVYSCMASNSVGISRITIQLEVDGNISTFTALNVVLHTCYFKKILHCALMV